MREIGTCAHSRRTFSSIIHTSTANSFQPRRSFLKMSATTTSGEETKSKTPPFEEPDEESDGEAESDVLDEKHVKRMRKAREIAGTLSGSTHSNSDVISTIMVAQNKVFGPLKLEDVSPEEKNRSRTHVNPLSKQFLEVSCIDRVTIVINLKFR